MSRHFCAMQRAIPRLIVFTAVLLVGIVPGALAADGSACIEANIDDEIVFPNGERHHVGSLRACLDDRYTPVSVVHRFWIDGKLAGFFLSDVGPRDTAPLGGPVSITNAAFNFMRFDQGPLVLESYTGIGGIDAETFRFVDRPEVTTRTSGPILALNESPKDDVEVVAIAAR